MNLIQLEIMNSSYSYLIRASIGFSEFRTPFVDLPNDGENSLKSEFQITWKLLQFMARSVC